MVVEGLRFKVGVSGCRISADALRDGPCEPVFEAWRVFPLPSTRSLTDRVASRDERFRLGDAEASSDKEGKEVKAFGDPGFASELVRAFTDPAGGI
jgi:hypothetical protein